jgi:hypothetical protein
MIDDDFRLGLIQAAWQNHRSQALDHLLSGREAYYARILFYEIEDDDTTEPAYDEVVTFRAIVYRKTIDILCGSDLIESVRKQPRLVSYG